MTAATVNNYIDHTTTPGGPLMIVDFTAPSDDTTPTVALPSQGDGKTWRFITGAGATGGTSLRATVSTNTATVLSGLKASERGTLVFTKS